MLSIERKHKEKLEFLAFFFYRKSRTSAAGLPFAETHSISAIRSSVVTKTEPWVITGASGETSTVKLAYLDLMPRLPIYVLC